MADFKTTKDFRKGRIFRGTHEDPTYLSFFIMFDYITHHSPLFNGEARHYLENVIGDQERVQHLDNFIKILKSVNEEMPWFWQSISGLDVSKKYGKMDDPFRGKDDNVVEISCLETVELTTMGMMDLYRRATYDFERYVEVLPMNLRRFSMYIYVTEVRPFKRNVTQELDYRLNGGDQFNTAVMTDKEKADIRVSKPFFKINLGHCHFDIDSGTDALAELSKSPGEAATARIKIQYETTHDADQMYANSIIYQEENGIAKDLAQAGLDKIQQIGGGLVDRAIDNIKGAIFLGNVYEANTISDIQDAVRAGSVNGLGNIIR